MTYNEKLSLCKKAVAASRNSYSPYSGFKVGAALLTKNKTIYLGCNIENSSYSVTNCAERVALQNAVSNGEKDFIAIAIAGGREAVGETVCSPCGVCRQALAEFCVRDEFLVLLSKDDGFEEYLLCDLLPMNFSDKNLK